MSATKVTSSGIHISIAHLGEARGVAPPVDSGVLVWRRDRIGGHAGGIVYKHDFPDFEKNRPPLDPNRIECFDKDKKNCPKIDDPSLKNKVVSDPQGFCGVASTERELTSDRLRYAYELSNDREDREKLIKSWSDIQSRKREEGKKAGLGELTKKVDEQIAAYKKSGSWTVFWMRVAAAVCIVATMLLFGASAILPIVFEVPSWLPWTALSVSIVFGLYVRAKLDGSANLREATFKALVMYRQLLDMPEKSSTLQPRSKCDLDLDKRFRSERKLGREEASLKLKDLNGRTLYTGLADSGAKVGQVLSYYNLDVDPRISKAYIAAEHFGLPQMGDRKWFSLAKDVALAKADLQKEKFAKYDDEISKVRAAAYEMATPFTDISGMKLERDDVKSLALLKAEEGKNYKRLLALEEEAFKALWPLIEKYTDTSGHPPRDWFKDVMGMQSLSDKRSNEALTFSMVEHYLTESETLAEKYQKFLHDHYENYLNRVANVLVWIGRLQEIEISREDLDGQKAFANIDNFNDLVKAYREVKKLLREQADKCKIGENQANVAYDKTLGVLRSLYTRDIEPLYIRLKTGREKEKGPTLSLCERCARVWSIIKEAVTFSTKAEPFDDRINVYKKSVLADGYFDADPHNPLHALDTSDAAKIETYLDRNKSLSDVHVIHINEMMKKIDQAIVNKYFTKEVVVGWLAVVVMAFIEYYFFSSQWVLFGINAAFLVRIPLMMWIEKNMRDDERRKDALRLLEGLHSGPGLDLSPSNYPPHMKKDKQLADRFGIDGVASDMATRDSWFGSSLLHMANEKIPVRADRLLG